MIIAGIVFLFTLTSSGLKYAGSLSISFPTSLALSPPLSRLSSTELSLEDGRREAGGGGDVERAKERRGGHGNGGMRRERFLSLPLFFVAVTGPQKQERVVHLQVAAVSSFIGWLWM